MTSKQGIKQQCFADALFLVFFINRKTPQQCGRLAGMFW